MSTRRKSREAALQFLCGMDVQGFLDGKDIMPTLNEFYDIRPLEEKGKKFSTEIILGVMGQRTQIDERLTGYLDNFQLARLALIDRNILRIALFEMFHDHDVPPVVIINECIEIAKKFGSEDSSRFVNGILDRAAIDSHRALRT
jgi:N utilization substance protein B